ncbi:MAG: hypothetical protein K6L74_06615 [Neptuniibacter sp.]
MSSTYQKNYWTEMGQLKLHTLYLSALLKEAEDREKSMNVFLAIASSSSIGAWAVWDKYTLVFAFIIALSQLLYTVKAFLPFRKRETRLPSMIIELQSLFLTMENQWFSVSEGKLSEEQIHKLHHQIKVKKQSIFNKYSRLVSIPEMRHKIILLASAQRDAKQFFDTNYRS